MTLARIIFLLTLSTLLAISACAQPCTEDHCTSASDLAGRADIDARYSDELPTPQMGERIVFTAADRPLPKTFSFEARRGDWFDISLFADDFDHPTFVVTGPGAYYRWSPKKSEDSRHDHASRTVFIPRDGTYEVTIHVRNWDFGATMNTNRIARSYSGYLQAREAPEARPLHDISEPIYGQFTDLENNLFILDPQRSPELVARFIQTHTSESDEEQITPRLLRFQTNGTIVESNFPEDAEDFAANLDETGVFLIDYAHLADHRLDSYELEPLTTQPLEPGATFSLSHNADAGQVVTFRIFTIWNPHLDFYLRDHKISFIAQEEAIFEDRDLLNWLPSDPYYSITEVVGYSHQQGPVQFSVTNNGESLTRHLPTISAYDPHDLGQVQPGDSARYHSDQIIEERGVAYIVFTLSEAALLTFDTTPSPSKFTFYELHNKISELPPRGYSDRQELEPGHYLLRAETAAYDVAELVVDLHFQNIPEHPLFEQTLDLSSQEIIKITNIYNFISPLEISISREDQLLTTATLHDYYHALYFLVESSGNHNLTFQGAEVSSYSPPHAERLSPVQGGLFAHNDSLILTEDNLAAAKEGRLLIENTEPLEWIISSHDGPDRSITAHFHPLQDLGAPSLSTKFPDLGAEQAHLDDSSYLLDLRISDFASYVELTALMPSTILAAQNGPWSIPDNDPQGITTELEVQNCSTLHGVEIQVDISHSWIGDLQLQLTSPSGTTTTLRALDGDNATSLVGRYPHTLEPAESLDIFTSENANGAWTLNVSDQVPFHSGLLVGWSIITRCE